MNDVCQICGVLARLGFTSDLANRSRALIFARYAVLLFAIMLHFNHSLSPDSAREQKLAPTLLFASQSIAKF